MKAGAERAKSNAYGAGLENEVDSPGKPPLWLQALVKRIRMAPRSMIVPAQMQERFFIFKEENYAD